MASSTTNNNMVSINNFPQIEQFMKLEAGHYYKFEALVRNTDGPNPLWKEGLANCNKNILIKNWYIDSTEYYDRVKTEMIELCNMTHARLYITLDRKSTSKTFHEIYKDVTERALNTMRGNELNSMKSIAKIITSNSSIIESTSKGFKTLMIDVDTKNEKVLNGIKLFLTDIPYMQLSTKKGYHIVFKQTRRMSLEELQNTLVKCIKVYCELDEWPEIKTNALGLVYMQLGANNEY